ncbi:MAG TPA: helix-hairpin-helix domain-containing protein [Desulfocapsa sulfexigens]|nr:helix-hairpin-helix domain-containing protein [Desulfocapsa sulfexigens]
MQFRTLCIIFTVLITVAFMTPTQGVVAKTATDSSTSDTKKKSTKKKDSKKKTSKKKDSKSSKKKDSKKKTPKKSSKKSKKAATGKININTATAAELTLITGIGPVTAKNIISYRKKNGKFKSAKDLLNVKGIGETTMKKMKSQLKLK